MSKSVKRIIGVVVAVAIPFAAPAIAGSILASAGIAATTAAGAATGAMLATSALTGAALGAGSAAQPTKEAVIAYEDTYKQHGRFLLTVHDELDICAPVEHAESEMKALNAAMNAFRLATVLTAGLNDSLANVGVETLYFPSRSQQARLTGGID